MAPKEISRGILLPGKEKAIFDWKTSQGKGEAVEQRAAERPARLHPDTVGKVFTGQTVRPATSVSTWLELIGKHLRFGSSLVPHNEHPFSSRASSSPHMTLISAPSLTSQGIFSVQDEYTGGS